MASADRRDHIIAAPDGTHIHARDSGPPEATGIPLLCLPGLTRTVRDFAPIEEVFASERRVIAVSFRGRGRSGRADPHSYRPQVEAADTLAVLAHLKVPHVIVIGTSRGGIVAMIMAAMARSALAGIVFNDIGPAIMPEGLLRIGGYLGKQSPLRDWDAAISSLRSSTPGFDSLTPEEWLRFARQVYATDSDGQPVHDYDPALGETFPSRDDILSGKVPELWELFASTSGIPVGVLRGERSDLLSAETVARMAELHPGLIAAAVPQRGHVPFLDEPASLAVIRAVIAAAEALQSRRSRPPDHSQPPG